MKSETLCQLAVHALEDLKGIDIITLDVRTLTSITDYMVICTGRSTRHIQSLAENAAIKAKEMNISPIRSEGDKDADWILVDLGNVVVHAMLESARTFYSLEDLWTPVKTVREQHSNENPTDHNRS